MFNLDLEFDDDAEVEDETLVLGILGLESVESGGGLGELGLESGRRGGFEFLF